MSLLPLPSGCCFLSQMASLFLLKSSSSLLQTRAKHVNTRILAKISHHELLLNPVNNSFRVSVRQTSTAIGKGAQIIAPNVHQRTPRSPASPAEIKTKNPTFFNEIRHGPGPQKGYQPVPGIQPMAPNVTFDDLQRLIADHKERAPHGKIPVSWIKACFMKVTTRKQLQIAVEQFQKEMLDPVNVQTIPKEDFCDEVIKACMRTDSQSVARALLKKNGFRIWPSPLTFLKAINMWSYTKTGQIKTPELIALWIRLFRDKQYKPFPEFISTILENLIKASPNDLKVVRVELAEPYCPEYFTVDNYNMLLQASMTAKDTHTIEATLKQIDGLPLHLGEKMRRDDDRFVANEVAARIHLKQTEKAAEILRGVSKAELASAAFANCLRQCTENADLQPEVAKLAPLVQEKGVTDAAIRTGFEQLAAGKFAGFGADAKGKTSPKPKKENDSSAETVPESSDATEQSAAAETAKQPEQKP